MVVDDFPIGVNPDQIRQILSADATQSELHYLKQTFRGKKVILGVDRLDYIKGIPQKLLAFDTLLHDHPELKENVILIQVAIPTRADLDEYKVLRKEVEQLVGNINGKHG
jgi:trehalose-6-phosphate synthase